MFGSGSGGSGYAPVCQIRSDLNKWTRLVQMTTSSLTLKSCTLALSLKLNHLCQYDPCYVELQHHRPVKRLCRVELKLRTYCSPAQESEKIYRS